ncbi:MAG: hypothetical protein WHX52_10260 [Anaerolineae bacterium]
MTTIQLELPESQVLKLVRQLSPAGKRAALYELIPALDELDTLVDEGDKRIRALCAERGVEWDALTESQRMQFVDTLLHEDSDA